jgi:hydrogenase maturation protease
VTVRVVGVGSGFGDDAIGLAVVDWLATQPLPAGVELARCERPLPDLLDACEDAQGCVVVDALRSGDRAGRVRRLDAGAIATHAAGSSHGFGVARALALAEALGRGPARVAWVGIEVGAATPAAPLSAAARDAIAPAGRLALALAREIAGLAEEP